MTTTTGERTLSGLVRYFLKLGGNGFGGPIALVGYMQRDPVEERRSFTEAEFIVIAARRRRRRFDLFVL
jgi:chromate transporter